MRTPHKLWRAFLSPLRGYRRLSQIYPRLAPWAAFLRRFAAGAVRQVWRGTWPHTTKNALCTTCLKPSDSAA